MKNKIPNKKSSTFKNLILISCFLVLLQWFSKITSFSNRNEITINELGNFIENNASQLSVL